MGKYSGKLPYVFNPNLDYVKGEPPHYWKISKDNLVVPMNAAEKNLRDLTIKLHGCNNNVEKRNGIRWKLLIATMVFIAVMLTFKTLR